jgi:hypothetical protein
MRGPFIVGYIYPKVPDLMENRPFNISLFSFHNDKLKFFEKLISRTTINFSFTNIEDTRTITSAMKLSIKISLFQWNQVFKHPEWKHMIDTWFRTFKVSINLNIFFYYINSVSFFTLIKISCKYFNYKEKFEWDIVDNAIARRIWEIDAITR